MNDGSVSSDLYHFFAAYFHQDWDLEADDWQGIVDGYVNGKHPTADFLRTIAQEIDELRSAYTEPELEQLLAKKIGVYYDPQPMADSEWLGQVAKHLRQHATAIQSGSAP